MLRLLKLILLAAVFGGCFFIAFLGFQIYMRSATQSADGGTVSASKADDEPSSGSLSSIVEDYKRAEEMTKAGTPASGGAPGARAAAGAPGARAVQTPGPNHKMIREWSTGRKLVALTYDDGPNPKFTPQLIELLKSKNVRATFFLIGPNVEKNPELARQLAESGFELGNHSWTHPVLNKLDPAKAREELAKTNDAIKAAAGVDAAMMRPPFGMANAKVQQVCEELGLKIICWNIDTNDWREGSTSKQMEDLILKNLRDGTIILMHDRYPKSIDATAAIIDQVRAKGFEFVTVSELLGLRALGDVAKPAAVAEVAAASAPEPAPPAAGAPSAPAKASGATNPLPAPRTAESAAPAAAAGAAPSQPLPEVATDKVTRLPSPAGSR